LVDFVLRPATEKDHPAIRALIRQVRINPASLDWRRFTVAESGSGDLIACGQLKPVPGGLWELASLAVRPTFRKMGVANAIIKQLCSNSPRPLYLTCRSALGVLYQKYGFEIVNSHEVPRYYRRLQRLAGIFMGLSGINDHLLVMKLD
jgi:N-acetylglutamate synthase-like GNAT family acetyltransferase